MLLELGTEGEPGAAAEEGQGGGGFVGAGVEACPVQSTSAISTRSSSSSSAVARVRGGWERKRGEKIRRLTRRLLDVSLLRLGERSLERAEDLVPHVVARLVERELDRVGHLALDVALQKGEGKAN